MPWPVQAAAAAATGLVLPQVGPLARVRWRPITRHAGSEQRRLVDAAFSYEGAADEASFVVGPALVGGFAALLAPAAALLLAAVVLAVFGSLFALHETADLTRRLRAAQHPATGRLLTPALVLLAVAQLAIGIVFGSAQTATSVLATAAGVPGMTGLLHALLGVGSVVAGLAVTALPASFGYERRMRLFAVALFVLALPLLFVDSLGVLAFALLVLGLAVAPYMISVFTLAERVTPVQRTGAAMTALAATTGLGYAVGSAIAGRLADWAGTPLPSPSPSAPGCSPPSWPALPGPPCAQSRPLRRRSPQPSRRPAANRSWPARRSPYGRTASAAPPSMTRGDPARGPRG